mmetsp:Transcript_24205/g.63207  ORF Transcript_24205/g.63207 Transcript_24205/m.63207 type:complete len:184 (+) Transcript_24205:80-631(+)|eukprot:CAMPEP_0182923598 /NCGR_PEP_ID=MMETSP0105_2-20130417/5532_1 /TAXON_ID=81532 ORGANISM="Acanthoeca-like sp., Strain 10tr" /NCGR_SAMPLE_ID=MMETSP0105_2 /ASSEMBLY_ACC=CAM_ASM_000205 /LENGTH=183 /DNA_ID=CAMNT_0025061325 /DNA_START=74 /DNA_END=625 /DNA_ORIENTATION=-
MTTTRPFKCDDLFKFNRVNLDPLTETYNMSFYFKYLARWPDYFSLTESTSGRMMGYIMGKAEGAGKDWHGHVTAVTVAPEYRRLGLAKKMMDGLEELSEKKYNGYFVDLFVRRSNDVAVAMYQKFGYEIYRTVLKYYTGDAEEENEDAFDMRKALARDPKKESMVPLGRDIHPHELHASFSSS